MEIKEVGAAEKNNNNNNNKKKKKTPPPPVGGGGDRWSTVPQSAVRLGASDPCVLQPQHTDAGGLIPALEAASGGRAARLFRPYLESLSEEAQMAVALRLTMEHMCDVYVLDRTVGYARWATENPEAHARIAEAKRADPQPLVLPARLDDLLAMLPP